MEPEVQGIRPLQQGLPSVKYKASYASFASTRDFEGAGGSCLVFSRWLYSLI